MSFASQCVPAGPWHALGMASVFDHLSLGVRDLDRAVAFYDAALAPLGLVRVGGNHRSAQYAAPNFDGEPPFAVIAFGEEATPPETGQHVAFAARDRAVVAAFHSAAVANGGVDDGGPGIREHYGPGYYAAFVRDPDGHRLEAVFHEPDGNR
ncbi:MAG: VOC family protein [Myxococcota bacterium]